MRLPGAVTAGVGLLVVVAGLLTLLDRLGPVSSSPAATAWLLPLPADRRGLLRLGDRHRSRGVGRRAGRVVA